MDPSVDIRVAKKYKLLRRLGYGSFGEIYEGVDLETQEEVAIKIEAFSSKLPQLYYESKVYKCLNGGVGIPKMHLYLENEGSFNVMIIDKLGPSLEDLFNTCNRKFSLKTVLMLADQMIRRLEFMHEKCLVHRDIKPDNFLMGIKEHAHNVYIIDFGLAKRFYDKALDIHLEYRENKPLTGTARYASVNTHLGIEQSRRDDLESLGYVLLYFLRGSLPWQGLQAKGRTEKYTLIFEKKISTPIEKLTEGFPEEFATYLNYCRSLRFVEMPDYKYLRKLFRDLFYKLNFDYDHQWDWIEGTHNILNNIIVKNQRFGDPFSNFHHHKKRDDHVYVKYNFVDESNEVNKNIDQDPNKSIDFKNTRSSFKKNSNFFLNNREKKEEEEF